MRIRFGISCATFCMFFLFSQFRHVTWCEEHKIGNNGLANGWIYYPVHPRVTFGMTPYMYKSYDMKYIVPEMKMPLFCLVCCSLNLFSQVTTMFQEVRKNRYGIDKSLSKGSWEGICMYMLLSRRVVSSCQRTHIINS